MYDRHWCLPACILTQKVVLCLREDGSTVPEGVSKWADESNWMGGDAVVLTADTAEVHTVPQAMTRHDMMTESSHLHPLQRDTSELDVT